MSKSNSESKFTQQIQQTPIEGTPVMSEVTDTPPVTEPIATEPEELLEIEPEVSTFEMVPFYKNLRHPDAGVTVLCELDGHLDPKDRPFVKGQWDDHEQSFFTTVNSHYEKINVNRWLELK